MILIEEEISDEDSGMSALFSNSVRTMNFMVIPRILLLSNSVSSSRSSSPASGVPTAFVVTKPLKASMLAASLQRAMGVVNRGNYRNGELHMLLLEISFMAEKYWLWMTIRFRVAAGALKKYGADVVNAERGKEAISLLTPPHQIDACFMDIHMPEMDGFEATERIRDIESSINNRIQSGELVVEVYQNV